MITNTMNAEGINVYWGIGANTSRPMLHRKLWDIGYGDYVPEERTPYSCLQSALQVVFKRGKDSSRILIRPLEDEIGFTVVREDRGREENSYPNESTWMLPDDHHSAVRGINGAEVMHGDEVRAEFERQKLLIGSASVGTALVKMAKALGAVTKKPEGGLYWLTIDKLPEWKKIAEAVEAASGEAHCKDGRGPSNRVYAERVIMDADAVRAVGDGICNEVTASLDLIKTELADGLGKRAIGTRQAKVADLVDKLESFEKAFGVPLDIIRKNLDEATNELAKAAILDTADALREEELVS